MKLIDDDMEEPPGGWAPDPPGLEWALARLQSGEPLDDALESLEVLAAIMFSSEEEADEFAAWVHRQRRGCDCECGCEA